MNRLLTSLLILIALAGVGCGDDDEDSTDTAATTTPVETQTQTQAEPDAENGCTDVEQPSPKPEEGGEKPTEELSGEWEVTFETNCGAFTIEMDEQGGGLSAASFVQLAENGFFEGTFFHRIAPGFVIQGGDPTGGGAGGPGYVTRDAPPPDAQYPKYTVAMAKSPTDPPGSSGSQFFVMTGDGGLPPEYAIVGEVTGGRKVVDRIGRLGDAAERPTQTVVIEKATAKSG